MVLGVLGVLVGKYVVGVIGGYCGCAVVNGIVRVS